jgi:hypothetical protein
MHTVVWAALALGGLRAQGQAAATAVATVRLSGWAGMTGNYTGVELAKNADVTAGVDLSFRPLFAGFAPSLEARGMYPVAKGSVVSEENLVGGLKLSRSKDRFHGYGDFLYGRGRLDYAQGGYPDATHSFLVLSNTSSVYSLGGGVDVDLATHLGVKADVQLQRYQTPVTATGSLYSKVFTVAFIYRVGFRKIR